MHNTHACDREEILYRRWESLSGRIEDFHCLGGENVTVLSPGRRNDLAGPDFRDAVLLIDNRLVVGPVEMHRREADWFAHGHHDDPAYRSVLLHVIAMIPPGEALRLSIPTLHLPLDSVPASAHTTKVAANPLDRTELANELASASWRRLLRRVDEFHDALRSGGRDGYRRHLLVRSYDALGYSSNREPMRMLAADYWEECDRDESVSRIIRYLLERSGIRPECRDRIERLIGAEPDETDRIDSIPGIAWDYSVRPGSSPEWRILAAGMLTPDIISGYLMREARRRTAGTNPIDSLRALLTDRFGRHRVLGIGRCDELIVNVLIPGIIATAILSAESELIAKACRCYRRYPSLASNHVIRSIERRWNGGKGIAGAFFQQGAIELHQTYFADARSR